MFVCVTHSIRWSMTYPYFAFLGVQTQPLEIRKRLGGSTLFVSVVNNALGASGQKMISLDEIPRFEFENNC